MPHVVIIHKKLKPPGDASGAGWFDAFTAAPIDVGDMVAGDFVRMELRDDGGRVLASADVTAAEAGLGV